MLQHNKLDMFHSKWQGSNDTIIAYRVSANNSSTGQYQYLPDTPRIHVCDTGLVWRLVTTVTIYELGGGQTTV